MSEGLINDGRRRAVVAWLESIGIHCNHRHPDAQLIPLAGDALVVTPINEGELRVDYRVYDQRILDHRVPLTELCGVDGEPLTYQRSVVTDQAPPGFHLPSWNGLAYITTDGERCSLYAEDGR